MIHTHRLKQHDRDWLYRTRRDIPLYYISANLNDDVLNEYLDCCVLWCYNKFGDVEGIDLPAIEWDWNDSTLQRYQLLGLYETSDNLIRLRIRGHRTFYNLAKTIIHEYTHYLQPRKGNWYDRFHITHGYYNNPYEIEAYYLADLYFTECVEWSIKQMKSTINKL